MRLNAERFVRDLSIPGAVAGGKVAQVPWAFAPDEGSVFLDAKYMDKLAFSPDHLREIADKAEAIADDGDEEDSENNQWSDADLLLRNRTNTVGLIETPGALKPLSADAQSVLLTPKLLGEMLDLAEVLGETDAVWFTVEDEKPAVATPKGEMDHLSAVVTPRTITNDDVTPPTGDY